MLGKIRRATSAKAQKVLGWTPRGNDEMIVVYRRKPDQARPPQAVNAASRVMRLSSVPGGAELPPAEQQDPGGGADGQDSRGRTDHRRAPAATARRWRRCRPNVAPA